MTFKELLKGRNVVGEIYTCDITRFFGLDVCDDREKIKEIRQALNEIIDEIKN